jgi:MarR family transcriptional regulator, organic hydroperoxide resistance regulator
VTAKQKNIQAELKQSKPFKSTAEETFLTLQRTADIIERRYEQFLKQWEISGTQYNVLRILRGAGPEGHRCGAIAERMVTHDPDITRLLDRIEKVGWIERARDTKDRRVVITRITRKGLDLLKQIDKPLEEFTRSISQHVGDKQLRQLSELLNELRNFPETND